LGKNRESLQFEPPAERFNTCFRTPSSRHRKNGHALSGSFAPILLKSRKSNDLKNLANAGFWTTPQLGWAVALVRTAVVVFLRCDEVPHIVAHETHERL